MASASRPVQAPMARTCRQPSASTGGASQAATSDLGGDGVRTSCGVLLDRQDGDVDDDVPGVIGSGGVGQVQGALAGKPAEQDRRGTGQGGRQRLGLRGPVRSADRPDRAMIAVP
jgi:hypothetical protein